MGWKSVAWAACLFPVLAGCGTVRNLTSETGLLQPGNELGFRRDAQVAWQGVCAKHPQRSFTDEFQDGFLDGYAGCLDCGGTARPPARAPLTYLTKKKYFSPERNCLVRDYYLGFKCGTDAVVASGRRGSVSGPGLSDTPAPTVPTVPAPPPMPPPRPVPDNKVGPPRKSDDPPLEVRPPNRKPAVPGAPSSTRWTFPKQPKPEVPVIPPFNPDLSGGGKFAPIPVPADPDLLPVPNPPLPNVPVTPIPVPTNEPAVTIPPVTGPLPTPVPVMKVPLSGAPSGVGAFPASVPTPGVLILDTLPVIPFKLTIPPVVPVGFLPQGK